MNERSNPFTVLVFRRMRGGCFRSSPDDDTMFNWSIVWPWIRLNLSLARGWIGDGTSESSVADRYCVVDVRSSNHNNNIQIEKYYDERHSKTWRKCLWSTLIYSQALQCTMPRETLLTDLVVRLLSPCQPAVWMIAPCGSTRLDTPRYSM